MSELDADSGVGSFGFGSVAIPKMTEEQIFKKIGVEAESATESEKMVKVKTVSEIGVTRYVGVKYIEPPIDMFKLGQMPDISPTLDV